jgi:hypothetical protein
VPLSVAPCAEFPNDNPALHRGATWVCERVVGPPSATTETVDAASEWDGDIEIVDDLDATDGEDLPLEDDRFSSFARMLADIARTAGDAAAADRLTEALTADPTARAWRAILLGESDDFAACGSKTLDEWAADLIAQSLATPSKADLVRRELRSRGVAAFGLVVESV